MSIHLRTNAADLTASLARTRRGGLASGTYVLTVQGPRPVQELRLGDQIVTSGGQVAELRAITRQNIDKTALFSVQPDALGQGRPALETRMSPGQHVMVHGWRAQVLFGGDAALVPIWRLADGRFVAEQAPDAAQVFELHFDSDVILHVNGLEVGAGTPVAELIATAA